MARALKVQSEMTPLFSLIFILSLTCGISINCEARVDIDSTKRLILPDDPAEPLLSAENTQRILPKKIEAGESGASVVSQMMDNSFSLWWEKSAIKQTSIGRAADKIEKNLKTEMNLGTSGYKKTEHKISIKLLAMQALAKIEYKGWVRAGLNYDARAAKTEAAVTENISEHQDLMVSHTIQSGESKSQVSLLWNW